MIEAHVFISKRRAVVGVLLLVAAGLIFEFARPSGGGARAANVKERPMLAAQEPSLAPGAVRTATPYQQQGSVIADRADDDEASDRPPTNGHVVDTAVGRKSSLQVGTSPAELALSAHLESFGAAGPTAQARFDASLANLRKDPRGAVRAAKGLYESAPKQDYASRTIAAMTLRQLETHEALDALGEIASEPIPEGLVADGHGESPAQAEAVLRMVALDGLGALAKRGNGDAQEALVQFMKSGPALVRRSAAQEYVEADGYSREARRFASSLLPADEDAFVDAVLDASAYAQLATVNDQEQMLLLREFVNAPPDDRTVLDAVSALAERPETAPEVRARALVGLVRAGGFDTVVGLLSQDTPPISGADGVQAIAACGVHCSASWGNLATSGTSSRVILLEGIAQMPERDAASALQAISASLPPDSSLTFSELDQLRFLRRRYGR